MQVGEQVGPFTIEKELGSGAMGTVYRALYRRDDGRAGHVALKVVSFGLLSNDGAMARFDREAAILKQLRHPHIVRLIAVGRHRPKGADRKLPFIAMEFVDGEALDRVLVRRGRLGWEDVVAYGRQLCEALQHAHEKGIIHRDLKPSNLMLSKDGRLKLTDFGIAKDDDATALTAQNNTIGTAAYMSPEQCRGDKGLTAKSDLYSLGVVFYELLTGRKPFTAETTMDLFLKHVNEKPVRPAKAVPDLPVWVDNLVMFLLEKDREQRPLDAATVGRMLADIEQKVTAGASAGETVAKSRRVDRKLGDGPLSDTDKQAAQALRGKKKKKKPARAWYEATWVKAVPVVLALGGVVGTGVYFLWPDGLDKRYALIEAAGSPEAKLEAAREFLVSTRGRTGPEVDAARAAFQALAARDKERVLTLRHGKKLKTAEGFDPDLYPDALLALDAERAGELKRAADLWDGVRKRTADDPAKLPDDDEVSRSCLGWIAARHLDEINTQRPAVEAKLMQQLAQSRDYDTPLKLDGPDGAATRAVLFEQFQDPAKAKAAWQALLDQTEREPDKRAWFLLAAQKVAAAGDPKDEPGERAGRLAGVLAAREQAVAADPSDGVARRAARNAAREVTVLYDDDPTPAVKAAVARAKALAEKAKGPGG